MFWRKKVNLPIQTGSFQLSAELPNKRGIGCTISILQGEDLASINAKLDLAQTAIERQRYRCEVPELEAARDQRLKAMEQAREVLADLEDRQNRNEKLTSNDIMTIRNLRTNLAKAKEDLEKGDAAIVEAKHKASAG